MRQTDFSGFRRLLIGTPLPTSAHHEERYTNAEALKAYGPTHAFETVSDIVAALA